MPSSRRDRIKETLVDRTFDLLVIGGGATGCGVALEAATRGLTVALVERDDYASGSSSRSTKLIHGGVRYLEQAVRHFDSMQYNLVQDALGERATFFRMAPFAVRRLPILTPLYSWMAIPYYWMGLKAYDWIAGQGSLGTSRFLSKAKVLQRFPTLKSSGLRGAVIYYDGQFNDARMALLVAMTAIREGATCLNHCKVTALGREQVECVDLIDGQPLTIRARQIVNATGPFTDTIRKLDNVEVAPLLKTSAGTHLLLPKHYAPSHTGMLIPNTRDNRILFLLPWEGAVLAGTTDRPAQVQTLPHPTEDEIQFILDHLSHYFGKPIPRTDVLSAWTGFRPLVDTGKATAKLSRDHYIERSPSGLLTITGGKWTTYRKMAEDVVDTLHPPHPSRTREMGLIGTQDYTKNLSLELQKKYSLSRECGRHLTRTYGGRAKELLAEAESTQPLIDGHPYLTAEVRWACRHEHAATAVDVLARRTRLAFLDRYAAREALPTICEEMAKELGWNKQRLSQETEEAELFLTTMGDS